jgi:hypothetical protein
MQSLPLPFASAWQGTRRRGDLTLPSFEGKEAIGNASKMAIHGLATPGFTFSGNRWLDWNRYNTVWGGRDTIPSLPILPFKTHFFGVWQLFPVALGHPAEESTGSLPPGGGDFLLCRGHDADSAYHRLTRRRRRFSLGTKGLEPLRF